jgi:lysophospholipase L1-like esterase
MRLIPSAAHFFMLTLYKIALAPALLLQSRRLRKTAIRLPEANGSRSGTAGTGSSLPLKILFIGDSSAAGVGVDWQHEAMPQQAAEIISIQLNRPVVWQIIAKSGVNTREALELFHSENPHPADIVVSALGVNDVTSQRSVKGFISDYLTLLREIALKTGARNAIISGLPPLRVLPAAPQPLRWYLGQYAMRLDRSLRKLCASQTNTRFVSLTWAEAHEMARDKFHPGKTQYRRWAEMVANEAVALISLCA